MRRIRLDRRNNPREQAQRVELTAGELRTRLDEQREQGRAEGQVAAADAMATQLAKIASQQREIDSLRRNLDIRQSQLEQTIAQHNKEEQQLQDEIARLKNEGPLGLLNNKVRRNANNRATKTKKTSTRALRDRRHSRTR